MPFSTHPVALAGAALLPSCATAPAPAPAPRIVRRRCRCCDQHVNCRCACRRVGRATCHRATAAPGTPPPPRPFADVIKDAKEQPGLFPLWSKDDKVWIELKPEQFDQLYFLRSQSEPWRDERFAGVDGACHAARQYRRLPQGGQQRATDRPQLAATTRSRQRRSRWRRKAPATALARLHRPSPVHRIPERKSVLVEANALLLGDIPMITTALDDLPRWLRWIARNSYFRETQSRRRHHV